MSAGEEPGRRFDWKRGDWAGGWLCWARGKPGLSQAESSESGELSQEGPGQSWVGGSKAAEQGWRDEPGAGAEQAQLQGEKKQD